MDHVTPDYTMQGTLRSCFWLAPPLIHSFVSSILDNDSPSLDRMIQYEGPDPTDVASAVMYNLLKVTFGTVKH